MKYLVALLTLAAAGCVPEYPEYATDQALRRGLFKECMAALPEGPRSTRYNDWDEVVAECDVVSYRQAQVCVTNCPALPEKPR